MTSILHVRPLAPGLKNTRAQAWAQHEQWVSEQAKEPGKAFLMVMLERQRLEYDAGRFPWAWEESPAEDNAKPASKRAVRGAIVECIAENGGRHIGETDLWSAVQKKLPGHLVTRQVVRDHKPKNPVGRPPKGNSPKS